MSSVNQRESLDHTQSVSASTLKFRSVLALKSVNSSVEERLRLLLGSTN